MALRLLSDAVKCREGNLIELLVGGEQFFPCALKAIDMAQREVQIETYIFAIDVVGEAFFNAMCRASARGVKVRLVLDGFGARECVQTWVPALIERGVSVRVFHPEGAWFQLNPRRLRRMHRKMIVVDHQVAFVGGINLIDDMNHEGERQELSKATERSLRRKRTIWGASANMREQAMLVNKNLLRQELGPRYDFAVQLRGPVVQDVWDHMQWLWLQIGPNGMVTDTFKSSCWKARVGHVRAQLVVRDNFRFRRRIERAYLHAIGQAKHTLILSNAYFLPRRALNKAILAARLRGVQVQLLLQGRVEYHFQHYATQSLYASLLKAGVEIYEYQLSFLHAKVAVIDSHWATVGSSNLDPFSCLFAREANLIVYDPGFAGQLEAELQKSITNDSRQVQANMHAQRSFKERLLSWICYRLMLLAVLIGGFGGRY